jgi:hypothetical protein
MFETHKVAGVVLVKKAEVKKAEVRTWRSQGRSRWWTPARRHV